MDSCGNVECFQHKISEDGQQNYLYTQERRIGSKIEKRNMKTKFLKLMIKKLITRLN